MMARPSRNPAALRTRPFIASIRHASQAEGIVEMCSNHQAWPKRGLLPGRPPMTPVRSRGCAPLLIRRGHYERTRGRGDSPTLSWSAAALGAKLPTPLPKARQSLTDQRLDDAAHGYEPQVHELVPRHHQSMNRSKRRCALASRDKDEPALWRSLLKAHVCIVRVSAATTKKATTQHIKKGQWSSLRDRTLCDRRRQTRTIIILLYIR
jgi:hypothetical protein